MSLVAAGLVQQASMAVAQVREPIEALLPLGLMVLLLTAIVALVVWRRPAAIDFAAGVLLTLLVVIGAGAYLLGRAVHTPGVGGNILYLIASFVDLYFILPGMVAVAVLWLLLRNMRRSDSEDGLSQRVRPEVAGPIINSAKPIIRAGTRAGTPAKSDRP